jgi:archaellum component FlaC
MLNHEGSHHEYFEELCALAAGAQISEPEFVELQDHFQQCKECRSAYADFTDLLHNKLPLVDPELERFSKLPGFFSESTSYRERFLARMRKEGILRSHEVAPETLRTNRRRWFWPALPHQRLAILALATLLVAVGVLGYRLLQTKARYQKLEADQAALKEQLRLQSGLANNGPQDHGESVAPLDATAPVATDLSRNDQTNAELAKALTDRASAEARAKRLEDQLANVASALDGLRAQNDQTNNSREQLEKKLKDAEQVANAVRDNLQEIREARSKDSLTIAAQDVEIQKLSEKLTEQAEMLEQEKSLLEASRDVRDLMGARNFHIADVYDVDSKGKDQRAFGRIFYTEGKSTLIFYAFDLNDRNAAKRNASFQVWGKRGPAQAPAHSLGLFQIDDQKQNRWVLRFEDPQVLAEIDSVFVTVEPPGGSTKPTGRQFLFAYLNANPNRP